MQVSCPQEGLVTVAGALPHDANRKEETDIKEV
jgi:hypothetical protein